MTGTLGRALGLCWGFFVLLFLVFLPHRDADFAPSAVLSPAQRMEALSYAGDGDEAESYHRP
jgi:hypothetical protein